MTAESSSIDQFLRDFRETVVSATERLRQISADDSARQPGRDKWSVKEILGHLIDSAANNHQALRARAVYGRPRFSRLRTGEMGQRAKVRRRAVARMIQLWSSYNLHLAHVISAIPKHY
jgi:hypothetical protein